MAFPSDTKSRTEPVLLNLEYAGKKYQGEGIPIANSCREGVCFELDITLNNEHLGIIHCMNDGWHMDTVSDQGLVDAIGKEIFLWYE